MFGDDELGEIEFFAVVFVELDGFGVPCGVATVVVGLAVQKHDDIGVLFDRTRFAEVGHFGSVSFALFCTTVELGEADDRDFEFAGEGFD